MVTMTKYHDNDPHNATQEVLFGTEEEIMADYYCEQAEAELKEQLKALQGEITEQGVFDTYEDTSQEYQRADELRKEMDEAISEAMALANAGHEPKHDHAPGQGDIFSCPACIINSNR